MWSEHGAHQSLDQVADVADTACNAAIAVNGQILIFQRLRYEIRDHAPIFHLAVGTIRVEDTHKAGVQLELAIKFHRQRFAEALALVIARARADWVDVAPISFALWMLQRIAVGLRG